MNRRTRSRGMSLIEVLVSLVILSLGVLAVVALQLVAKRNNADAGQRTIAAQLAYDLIERMRANASKATLDAYLAAAPITAPMGYGNAGAGTRSVPAVSCTGTCTPAQMVEWDLYQWERALLGAAETVAGSNTGGLVMPTACVRYTPNSGLNGDGIYTVAIAWRSNIEISDWSAADITTEPARACGQDPQPAGANLYSKTGNDNLYRRIIVMPVYITARRTGS
jgi:type IV pilus assembly protein PilV